jgi:hypothetical protein
LLLEELTALLGNERFVQLLKQLRTHFPTLRASPPAAAHENCGVVEADESVQFIELVSEIEQRATQLEDVLSRYNTRYTSATLNPKLVSNANWSLTQTISSEVFPSTG